MPDKPTTHLYEPLGEATRRKIALARWRRNRVQDLRQGVSLAANGRTASIYYRSGDRFVELDAELAGDPGLDMCIYTAPGISSWIDVASLEPAPTTAEEQQHVLATIATWLRARPARASFV